MTNNYHTQVGAFQGYIRRPKPYPSGMLAIFFGEDGEDADTISALALTKFQDVDVVIKVYAIKDGIGRILKQENGEYPIVAEFKSKIRRPTPSKSGMLANFFAENGASADSVIDLGKSDNQDCLVFVEIFSKTDPTDLVNLANQNNQQKIKQAENTKTTSEKKEEEKQLKNAKEAQKLLILNGFYKNNLLWAVLDKIKPYSQWLLEKNVCISSINGMECKNGVSTLYNIRNISKFHIVPMCDHHISQMNNEEVQDYALLKHSSLIQEWAIQQLKQTTKSDSEYPNVGRVIDFASKNNIINLIPKSYFNFAELL